MEQKQWQRLMVQCLGMLVLCLGLCAVFSGGFNREMNTTLVKAEVHSYAKAERKDIMGTPEPVIQPEAGVLEQAARDKILVLDAGHGGTDEGAWDQSGNPVEKKLNLIIVKMLKERFEQTPGIEVYCTRLEDTNVPKKKRVAMANKLQADAFVSIHCNASEPGDRASRGVETLYSKRKTGKSQISNQALAQQILDSLSASTGLKNRGIIRREGLYLMHHSKVPTTIVEIGYISNKSDLKFLNSQKGREKVVDGIYNGIMTTLEGESK